MTPQSRKSFMSRTQVAFKEVIIYCIYIKICIGGTWLNAIFENFAREKVRGSKFLESVPLRLQKRKKRIYFTSELYVLGICTF